MHAGDGAAVQAQDDVRVDARPRAIEVGAHHSMIPTRL
jgi:hypothetical protein